MIAASNAGLFVPGLIIGIIIGVALVRASSTFRSRYGRLPWGIPSWGWFLIGFVLGLIGLVLYLIAHATTKRQVNQSAGYYAPPQEYPPPSTPQQSWSQPPGTQPPPPQPPPGSPPPYPTSGPTGQPPPPVDPPSSPPPAQNEAPPSS